jgi:hypothetical protein
MQRASSLDRTLSLPLHLSVNQASSKAASRIASVLGSNDPLPSPRMFPLWTGSCWKRARLSITMIWPILWSLPALEAHEPCTVNEALLLCPAQALVGPYVCSLRSSASLRLPPSCNARPTRLQSTVFHHAFRAAVLKGSGSRRAPTNASRLGVHGTDRLDVASESAGRLAGI